MEATWEWRSAILLRIEREKQQHNKEKHLDRKTRPAKGAEEGVPSGPSFYVVQYLLAYTPTVEMGRMIITTYG